MLKGGTFGGIDMKLRITTILILAALIGVSACGKTTKQKSGGGDEVKTDENASTDGKGKDDKNKDKGASKALAAGLITVGKDADAKNNKGETLLALVTSEPKDLMKNLQARSARFKAESKAAIAVVYATTSDAKKLSTVKQATYVSAVKVDAAGKMTADEITAPKLKIEDKDIELDALSKDAPIFPSKADVEVALAKPTQAPKITLDANAAVEMPSAVILGTQDKPLKEIVLDETKEGYVAEPVLFQSSFAGAAEDPSKPVCLIYASTPALDAEGKPAKDEKGNATYFAVKMENVLDLAGEDKKVDFSKISKEDFAKIPAATYGVSITCIKEKLDAAPEYLLSTATTGYTIKVVHAAPAKEEKKEEKKEEAKK